VEVVAGLDTGKVFRFTRGNINIGRRAGEVPLSDGEVSRRHSVIEVFGREMIFLRDLGSTNGTYHNGRRVAVSRLRTGDTIGVGNPAQVAALVAKVRVAVPHIPVRVHFHNTRGTGLANVWAAIAAGAVTVDASIGGLGGCPFAPGAAGNVSTEDVVYMLERAGVRTGLDLSALVSANHWLGEIMQRTLPGMVAKAPPFPKQA
jgi:isopropylmalate/homocitrate/citramalate synthase